MESSSRARSEGRQCDVNSKIEVEIAIAAVDEVSSG